MRKINSIESLNRGVNKTELHTIITFRNQQLLDLWVNEMSGQISDGMWENSRNTEWLWRNVLLRLGEETKVETIGLVGRRSFGMNSELWSCVGDRILDENGFETEKDAKKAWAEIAAAIRNAEYSREVYKVIEEAKEEREKKAKEQWPELLKEWMEAGIEDSSSDDYRSYSFWLEPENKVGYTSVGRGFTREGELRTVIRYGGNTYNVKKGHVKEVIEAIRTFHKTMKSCC